MILLYRKGSGEQTAVVICGVKKDTTRQKQNRKKKRNRQNLNRFRHLHAFYEQKTFVFELLYFIAASFLLQQRTVSVALFPYGARRKFETAGLEGVLIREQAVEKVFYIFILSILMGCSKHARIFQRLREIMQETTKKTHPHRHSYVVICQEANAAESLRF